MYICNCNIIYPLPSADTLLTALALKQHDGSLVAGTELIEPITSPEVQPICHTTDRKQHGVTFEIFLVP